MVIAHAGANCGRDGATTCGGEIINFAQNLTTKVDVIVSGHSHTLINTEIKGVPIVQARSSGRAVDVLDIALDTTIHVPIRHEVRERGRYGLASQDTITAFSVANIRVYQ